MQTYANTGTRAGTLTRLPLAERHWPIQYTNDDATAGSTAYPVNYDELYNLKGRLLTLIDATFTDSEQRKAHKDIVWQILRAWMDDIAHAGQEADGIGYSLKASEGDRSD